MSPAKTAAPIEMPFRLWTQVGTRNHVLHEGPDPLMGRGNSEGGKGHPIVKCRDTAVICEKMAEPIEIPFGLWAQMSRRNHCVRWGSSNAEGLWHGNQFWDAICYNNWFCCMIASVAVFDSRGGFWGLSCSMMT